MPSWPQSEREGWSQKQEEKPRSDVFTEQISSFLKLVIGVAGPGVTAVMKAL